VSGRQEGLELLLVHHAVGGTGSRTFDGAADEAQPRPWARGTR
jgi:hypothetical protein